MDMRLQNKIEKQYLKNDNNSFFVGDTVKVHNTIRDGDKTRTQIFRGVVISKKGSGTRSMFTVRKISAGIGVEKIFPVHSPNVEKIEVVKTGSPRRSKLYYLRDRVGKQALKVREGVDKKDRDAKLDGYFSKKSENIELQIAEVTPEKSEKEEVKSDKAESETGDAKTADTNVKADASSKAEAKSKSE